MLLDKVAEVSRGKVTDSCGGDFMPLANLDKVVEVSRGKVMEGCGRILPWIK